MNIQMTLSSAEQALAAKKLRRVIDSIADAAIQQDSFQNGTVQLKASPLKSFAGQFTGSVAYDPQTKAVRSLDLVCDLGAFATVRYKMKDSRYERVLSQSHNERSQVLELEPFQYRSELEYHGPFQPDYDEFQPAPSPFARPPFVRV